MKAWWILGLVGTLAFGQGERAVRPVDAGQVFFRYLESSCFRCHGESLQNGGLRLDLEEDLLSVIAPYKVTESLVFERMALPSNMPKAMPPHGPQAADEVLAAAIHWINAGAPMEPLVALRARREAAAAALARLSREAEALVVAVDEDGATGLRVDWSRGLGAISEPALQALAASATEVQQLSLAGRSLERLPDFSAIEWPLLRELDVSRSPAASAVLAAILPRSPGLQRIRAVEVELDAAARAALAGAAWTELYAAGSGLSAEFQAALASGRPGRRVEADARLAGPLFAASGPRRYAIFDLERKSLSLWRARSLETHELLFERELPHAESGPLSAGQGEIWLGALRFDAKTGADLSSLATPGLAYAVDRPGDPSARLAFVRAKGAALEGDRFAVIEAIDADERAVAWSGTDRILTVQPKGIVRERGLDGRTLREVVVVDDADVRHPNAQHAMDAAVDAAGQIWVVTGDRRTLLGFDARGDLVRSIAAPEDLRDQGRWAGLRPLAGGHWLVLISDAEAKVPLALEFDAQGELVLRVPRPPGLSRGPLALAVIEDEEALRTAPAGR